jgi:hypothetical protein
VIPVSLVTPGRGCNWKPRRWSFSDQPARLTAWLAATSSFVSWLYTELCNEPDLSESNSTSVEVALQAREHRHRPLSSSVLYYFGVVPIYLIDYTYR